MSRRHAVQRIPPAPPVRAYLSAFLTISFQSTNTPELRFRSVLTEDGARRIAFDG